MVTSVANIDTGIGNQFLSKDPKYLYRYCIHSFSSVALLVSLLDSICNDVARRKSQPHVCKKAKGRQRPPPAAANWQRRSLKMPA